MPLLGHGLVLWLAAWCQLVSALEVLQLDALPHWRLGNEQGWGNATVGNISLPADVHTALRDAGVVADPLYRCARLACCPCATPGAGCRAVERDGDGRVRTPGWRWPQ